MSEVFSRIDHVQNKPFVSSRWDFPRAGLKTHLVILGQ